MPTADHPKPLPAPQATLMATVINGLLSQNLPWALVIIGMAISAVVEFCGVNSLAFAVGAYLPLSTTSPLFVGGLIKWLVDRKKKTPESTVESEIGSGALFSSGLIAGGALTGILIAVLIGTKAGEDASGNEISLLDKFNIGAVGKVTEAWGAGFADLISLIAFIGLGLILLRFAKMRQE